MLCDINEHMNIYMNIFNLVFFSDLEDYGLKLKKKNLQYLKLFENISRTAIFDKWKNSSFSIHTVL